jgi:hypothetical protein
MIRKHKSYNIFFQYNRGRTYYHRYNKPAFKKNKQPTVRRSKNA